MRKLNVGCLAQDNSALEEKIQEALHNFNPENGEVEEQWKLFKESIYSAAANTLGFVKRKRKN